MQHFMNTLTNPFALILRDGATTSRLLRMTGKGRRPLALRFPARFMFQLTAEEKAEVVAHCDHLRNLKFSPVLPNAFTEHGAIMASTVLNTSRAIQVSSYLAAFPLLFLRHFPENRHRVPACLHLLHHSLAHRHRVQRLLGRRLAREFNSDGFRPPPGLPRAPLVSQPSPLGAISDILCRQNISTRVCHIVRGPG